MASKTSPPDRENWPGPRVSHADFTARRAELGAVDMPRNAGASRTPSKRALLKAIEDAGARW